VTGTNGGGAVTVASAASAAAQGIGPANTAPPVVSGSGKVGEQLSATAGSWTGVPAPSTAFEWQRCSSSGALCTDIQGATSSTFVPTVSDAGSTVVVRVTATNSTGSATAVSTPVAVLSTAPASVALPTITGNAIEGSTLTADAG